MSWSHFPCPHCRASSVPRWSLTPRRILTCETCGGQARVRWAADVWRAATQLLAVVGFTVVLRFAFSGDRLAYWLAACLVVGAVILQELAQLIPLRKTREHEDETILRSLRRHLRRRQRPPSS